MIKNIIFDWSGVVKDAVVAQLWKVNKVFNRFGIDSISMEEFKENFELPYMNFYNRYLPNVTKEQQDLYYKELSLSDECPHSDSFPGIIELIIKLKKAGYYLGIVSSDLPDTLLPELKEYNLENIFDDVVMNAHNKEGDILNIIEKRNLNKDNTYFIGDSNHEIEVAEIAGIKSIAVTWGFCTKEKLEALNPDFLVNNLTELESAIYKV